MTPQSRTVKLVISASLFSAWLDCCQVGGWADITLFFFLFSQRCYWKWLPVIGLNRVWPSSLESNAFNHQAILLPIKRKDIEGNRTKSLVSDTGPGSWLWPSALTATTNGAWSSVEVCRSLTKGNTALDHAARWKLCSLACLSGRGKRPEARPHNILVKTLWWEDQREGFCCCIHNRERQTVEPLHIITRHIGL